MSADGAREHATGRGVAPSTGAERFRAYLAEHGLKFTPERAAVLQEVLGLERHTEAEEILQRLRDAGSTVSRATVYRTLDLIVQAGLARKVRLGTDHYYFERVLGRQQHEHMICLSCGTIIEWSDPQLESLLESNLRKQRFKAARYSLQVFGTCDACTPSERDRSR